MSNIPYHGWTHAPKEMGGSDPIPAPAGVGPYAYLVWEGSETAQDDDPVLLSNLGATYGYVSDTSLLSVDLENFRIYLDAEGEGTRTLGGLWIAHLRVWFDFVFSGDWWGRIDWTMDGLLDGLDNTVGHESPPEGTLAGGNTASALSATSIMLINDAADPSNWITGAFSQISGGDEGFGYVTLAACRLAPYPGPNGELFEVS